ncbi:MAG: hypothetical protein J6J33_06030 [Clostridia bacterium]|nr:hypothetical protein [Clostridia bacterium]
METLNKDIVQMTLGEMKSYIAEWFLGTNSKIVAGAYDTFDRKVVITEEGSEKVIFEHTFTVKDFVTDDAIVSTSSILNDELRGLIAQCYRLDKQLEESAKERELNNNANQKQ